MQYNGIKIKYLKYEELSDQMIYDILYFKGCIRSEFNNIITLDTETSTINDYQLSYLPEEPEIDSEGNPIPEVKIIPEFSFVNTWTACIEGKEIIYSILGRDNTSLIEFIRRLREIAKQKTIDILYEDGEKDKVKAISNNMNKRYGMLKIFIHNLSYDMTFIFDLLKKELNFDNDDYIGTRSSIISLSFGYAYFNEKTRRMNKGYTNISFIDSLKYFNCKLSNLDTKVFDKTDGWDYKKFRTSYDVLDSEEELYARNDTLVLMEAYDIIRKEYGCLKNIPITKTGIPRKIIKGDLVHTSVSTEFMVEQKANFKNDISEMREKFYNDFMDTKIVNSKQKDGSFKPKTIMSVKPFVFRYDRALHKAFTAGVTTGNRKSLNEILYDITSVDIASSYPGVMSIMKFVRRYNVSNGNTTLPIPKFMESVRSFWNYAKGNVETGWMGWIKIGRIKARKRTRLLSLSYSKIEEGRKVFNKDYPNYPDVKYNCHAKVKNVYNGRIEEAENIILSINDIELNVLNILYKLENIEFIETWSGEYEPLPTSLLKTVLFCAREKTHYKIEKNKCKEDTPDYYKMDRALNFAKQNLNSCYGVCVENILKRIREKIIMNHPEINPSAIEDSDEYIKEYRRYLEDTYSFGETSSPYRSGYRSYTFEIGTQITAYARMNLMTFSLYVESEYCDTDSHKLHNFEKIEGRFNCYNNRLKSIIDEREDLIEAWNYEGKTVYLGIWDKEETYPMFVQEGSKRYLHTQYKDKTHTSVESIYVYFDENKEIISRGSDKFEEIFNHFSSLDSELESIEYIDCVKESEVSEYCKSKNYTYKIMEKIYPTFAGLPKDVVEFFLYNKAKCTTTIGRLRSLFGEDGRLYVPANISKKLTHKIIDINALVPDGEVVYDNTLGTLPSSCVVLSEQPYESNINVLLDQIRRISKGDISMYQA